MLKAWKRIRNYVKYDLREIIAPSSLPYPPGEEPPEKGWKDFFQTLRLATRDYIDTWKSEEPKSDQEPQGQGEQDETPLSEDLAGVARSGAANLKPMLQQLYRTRAAAYQEAVSSFVQGYREGFAGLPDTDDAECSHWAAQRSILQTNNNNNNNGGGTITNNNNNGGGGATNNNNNGGGATNNNYNSYVAPSTPVPTPSPTPSPPPYCLTPQNALNNQCSCYCPCPSPPPPASPPPPPPYYAPTTPTGGIVNNNNNNGGVMCWQETTTTTITTMVAALSQTTTTMASSVRALRQGNCVHSLERATDVEDIRCNMHIQQQVARMIGYRAIG
ncbi:hypothetical protein WJX75_008593 [Coccomyxa subellipsoidea]|uniref:Uncharacterized protein n=1 Tax=Coccomyxa subellipsoidea TaxID=248742 RepID=A0ABR2YNE4_9CHLO